MPANEITPTPVMMMPNGVRVTSSPRKTPIRESTTLDMMTNGFVTELQNDERLDDGVRTELVEAVEINTEEVKYLVKIGARLEKVMESINA